MNEFNMLVLNIAVIVFILTLVIVGIILYFSIKNSEFPPYTTDCPTYYRVDNSNCVFDDNLYPTDIDYPALAKPPTGECSSVSIVTLNPPGNSKDEVLCTKNRWAKNCGVFWDGVTNNSEACFRSNSLFPSSITNIF